MSSIKLKKNIKKLKFERNQIFKNILDTPLFDSISFSEDLGNKLLKVYKRNYK